MSRVVVVLFFLFGNVIASGLDQLILPEIKNDEFYWAIYQIAKNEPIQTILEIGASSGEGSTEAFVTGMMENASSPKLFCVEVSKTRFKALQERYAKIVNVKCYNVSSVPVEAFPSEAELMEFIKYVPFPQESGLSVMGFHWLRQDLEYIRKSGVPQRGIELIQLENNIQTFDVVLIDGCEFTGKSELDLVYGAKWILLDDIRTFKNYYNYKRLVGDPNYTLIEENRNVRWGYAIFKRIK